MCSSWMYDAFSAKCGGCKAKGCPSRHQPDSVLCSLLTSGVKPYPHCQLSTEEIHNINAKYIKNAMVNFGCIKCMDLLQALCWRRTQKQLSQWVAKWHQYIHLQTTSIPFQLKQFFWLQCRTLNWTTVRQFCSLWVWSCSIVICIS